MKYIYVLFMISLNSFTSYSQTTYHITKEKEIVAFENVDKTGNTIVIPAKSLLFKLGTKNNLDWILYERASYYIEPGQDIEQITYAEYEEISALISELKIKRNTLEKMKICTDSIKLLQTKLEKLTPKKGIYLLTCNPVYDNIVGADIIMFNNLERRIKYITANVQPYNQVDDPTSILKPLKLIGPIEVDGYINMYFENVWVSDVIDYLKIKSLIVQFMDNTKTTIYATQIHKVSEEYLETYNRILELLQNIKFLSGDID